MIEIFEMREHFAWGPQALFLKQRSDGNVERSRAAGSPAMCIERAGQ